MKIVKLFETSSMPEEIFKPLFEGGWILKNGTNNYTVGFVVHDMTISYNESGDDEYLEIIDKWKVVDDYFLKGGAKQQENILIHHGSFDLNPKYLF